MLPVRAGGGWRVAGGGGRDVGGERRTVAEGPQDSPGGLPGCLAAYFYWFV